MALAIVKFLLILCLCIGVIRVLELVLKTSIDIVAILSKALVAIISFALVFWVAYKVGIAIGDLFFGHQLK